MNQDWLGKITPDTIGRYDLAWRRCYSSEPKYVDSIWAEREVAQDRAIKVREEQWNTKFRFAIMLDDII